MDWDKIGLVVVAGIFIWMVYSQVGRGGGLKAMFERSRKAPQHWGTYAFLMALVVLFVYFLIVL